MAGINIIWGLKVSCILFKIFFTIVLTLLLISLLASCAAPATTTQVSNTSAPATNTQAPTTGTAPAATAAAAKPQGELTATLTSFGNENWLPWLDPVMANLHDIVYDLLIYWDHKNFKFYPGLAQSWEVTPDGMTLTYHLKKGIQFHNGWGEFTSADVKYNFEMQASPTSIGKVAQCRRIASMDTPDPYTLVVHFKDPYPTFYVDLSMANSTVCQGIVSKKYCETVGIEEAGMKAIGTGPYKLVENQPGSYFKFESNEDAWRVVPEFKNLTVRLMAETGTLVAALKNKEVDLAQVPAEQLADLKAAGVAVEVSPLGGNISMVTLGGMVIPEDKRYDAATANKDPWVDTKVRKAMAFAIDRAAICKAIYAGFAEPAAVPLYTVGMEKFKYPYDPEAAKQLLKEAGYPDGFSFKFISYTQPGFPDQPRVVEAVTGYWQQIGLDPKITVIDFATYNNNNRAKQRMAGEVSLGSISPTADMLAKYEIYFMPNAVTPYFEDAGSQAIYKQTPSNATFEQRIAMVEKLNQYYFDNVGPIPLARTGYCFAWNGDKISPFPHSDSSKPLYLEYVRHAKPLNTYRAFNPWPDR